MAMAGRLPPEARRVRPPRALVAPHQRRPDVLDGCPRHRRLLALLARAREKTGRWRSCQDGVRLGHTPYTKNLAKFFAFRQSSYPAWLAEHRARVEPIHLLTRSQLVGITVSWSRLHKRHHDTVMLLHRA